MACMASYPLICWTNVITCIVEQIERHASDSHTHCVPQCMRNCQPCGSSARACQTLRPNATEAAGVYEWSQSGVAHHWTYSWSGCLYILISNTCAQTHVYHIPAHAHARTHTHTQLHIHTHTHALMHTPSHTPNPGPPTHTHTHKHSQT